MDFRIFQTSSITASAVIRGGGGAGNDNSTVGGTGGSGGGGNGGGGGNAIHGTANYGAGGGANSHAVGGTGASGNGGIGVVILRMLTADYSGTTSGSPTVSTDGSDTILIFTGDGTYTG